MKIEKWKYKGEIIDVPILDKDEIEKNEFFDDNELENTQDLTQVLKDVKENHD